MNQNIKLKQNIVDTRRAIRKKLMLLKKGEMDHSEVLKKKYKPLLEPINKIIQTENELKNEIKSEKIKQEIDNKNDISEIHDRNIQKFTAWNSPKTQQDRTIQNYIPWNSPDVFVDEGTEETDNNNSNNSFQTNILEETNSATLNEYLEQYHPLPRQYIEELIMDGLGNFDTKTGIKYNIEASKLSIGNKDIQLNGKDLSVNGLRYEGTPGLYELLFKKEPLGFKKEDEINYIDIVKRSSALHRDYDPDKQMQGTRSYKYQNIIKKYVEGNQKSKKKPRSATWTGRGNELVVDKKTLRYVYWDNIEELVDRLVLLHASKQAGNTSHNNEIISIEEELREAGVIL